MQKSVVILAFILIVVVVLTAAVSKLEETKSKKKPPPRFSTTMSLRPYWYNDDLDISTEPLPQYTIDDFLKRGQELRRKGNHKKAEDIFKTAMLFDPENPETMKAVGELAYIDGRFSEASNYFTQYLIHKPHTVEAYTNLAISLIRANDLRSAQMITKKGISRLEKDQRGPLYLVYACIKQKTGNTKQAEVYLKKAFLALGPDILKLLNSKWASSLKDLDSYNDIRDNSEQ